MGRDELTQALAQTLSAEEAAYQIVLELVEAQSKALERNDLDELDRVTAKQIEAASALVHHGARRVAAADELGRALGLDPESATLRVLEAELPPAQARAIAMVGERLRIVSDRLQLLSERNKAMLVNGLRVSQHLISQILGSPTKQPVYAANGRMHARPDRSALEIHA